MIMRNLVCAGLVGLAAVMSVCGERVPLWPKGGMPDPQPHQIGAMTDETAQPSFVPDQHRIPYIEWYDPPAKDRRTGACMILISGGSYEMCCDVWLVPEWRTWLTERGVQCVNLVYRTPRPKGLPIYQSAWEDGQRAVRLVRSEAKRRGFDPERIGAISMSAGSHLNTLLATSSMTPAYRRVDALDDVPCHLNWSCTFAIAYGVTDGCGDPNSRDGDAVDAVIDPAFRFDAKTCPMFMSHGGLDPYSPRSSTLVYRRLKGMKIPAELHLYPDRGHDAYGFDRAVEFMRQMGFLKPLGAEHDLLRRYCGDWARAVHERKDIWPEGKMPDAQAHQCVPYIEWHIPKDIKTKSVQIVFSGGCYEGNDPDGFEVAPIRRFLNERGMAVVTLKYRTPRPKGLAKHTSAWQDLQRTVRIVRNEAPARGLNPDSIGIMGSSAGGHLALMGATSSRRRAYWEIDDVDKLPCNVQWAVAIYPAYALTDGIDGPNRHGGIDDDIRPVREFSFDLSTPPILFMHGDADDYSSMASVKCWEQLCRMGIQGELHTFATRGHCFQRQAAPDTGSFWWMERVWEFYHRKGFDR